MSNPCFHEEPECVECGTACSCVAEDCIDGKMSPKCCLCYVLDGKMEKDEICDECKEC